MALAADGLGGLEGLPLPIQEIIAAHKKAGEAMQLDFTLGDYQDSIFRCQARMLVKRGMLDPVGLVQVEWYTRQADGNYSELQKVR